MIDTAERNGKLITFYSYKGGTGRSMALANVAWILASHGKQVLVIDWDLEAPGLHRYFHPFLVDPDLTSTEGLIDFVWDFCMESVTPAQDASERGAARLEKAADLMPYTIGLDYEFGEGCLDFIPAGRQGPAYASRVNSFNWENFYNRLGGGILLEEVRRQLKRNYDFILIDSRTGVSDTSGICTIQLPDQLVVCFTCNNQSIIGSTAIVESALEQRERAGRKADEPLQVFPVLMRVDLAEKEKLDASRAFARKAFFGFPNHLEGRRREFYWRKSEVLYHSYYAYEEVLAAFGDSADSDKTLLSDLETLTGHLTNQEITELVPIPESLRLDFKAKYLRGQDTKVEGVPDLKDPLSIDLYQKVRELKEVWERSGRSPSKLLTPRLLKELSYAHDARVELLRIEGGPEFLEQSVRVRPFRRFLSMVIGIFLALVVPIAAYLAYLVFFAWAMERYGSETALKHELAILFSAGILFSTLAVLLYRKFFSFRGYDLLMRFFLRFRRGPVKVV
jgi:cellulose biosynthesis protein BcsQ